MSNGSYVESAIFKLSREDPYHASVLQEVEISVNKHIPTACLTYNKQTSTYKILLGEEFFSKLTLEERSAILLHEILHFTHGHFLRFTPEMFSDPKSGRVANIAADMSINQYIKGLPEGAIDVNKFVIAETGKPFPKFATAETYFKLLKDEKNQEANSEELAKYGEGMDSHEFDISDLTEEEQEKLLKEAKNILTRALDKNGLDQSKLPGAIKDLLSKIEDKMTGLNYKAVLAKAIKKTVTDCTPRYSWNRPNKRYGTVLPGTLPNLLPKIGVFIDTSGSISAAELNRSIEILNGLLKAGSKNCILGLWHTKLYFCEKWRDKFDLIERGVVESGGTDLTDTVQYINKHSLDLSIIITDGYYSSGEKFKSPNVVWLIANSTGEHPNDTFGTTIKLSDLTKE